MPFLLPRHLQAATRRAEPALPPGLWHTPLGRSACLSAAAVLVVGIGLPLLAGARMEDTGAPGPMLAGALLGATLAIGRRWRGLGNWLRTPAAPEPAPTLGEPFDQGCRRLQASLRGCGGRLVCHVGAAARDLRLDDAQLGRLLQSLEAGVRLLTESQGEVRVENRAENVDGTADAPSIEPGPGTAHAMLVRVDLDRLDGETGSHLRLRLSGGLRRTRPRCARRLRQLCTRLGAQLDIVEQAGLLQVEVVLRLSDEPA